MIVKNDGNDKSHRRDKKKNDKKKNDNSDKNEKAHEGEAWEE